MKRSAQVAMLFPSDVPLLRFIAAVLADYSGEWEAGRKHLTVNPWIHSNLYGKQVALPQKTPVGKWIEYKDHLNGRFVGGVRHRQPKGGISPLFVSILETTSSGLRPCMHTCLSDFYAPLSMLTRTSS
jgi:hypothetical protein